MKKVYLFLATMVAALSSCMEESALVPVTPENQVTIKAVAGETKTTLDGTAVIWEANDEIAVVLDKNLVTFAVEGTPNGAEANFVGTIASKDFEAAYAIYPATAYSYDQTITKVTLTHTLPAEQSGSVASGLNLSTAALTVEDLKAGEAEGVFHNALTLLKVTAPAGVKNVKFSVPHSKPALVGTATVTVNTQTGFAAVSGANGYEVTLASGSELNPAVTYDVLVYPANSTDLTLTMEGTDGTVYTSTVEGVELKASTYKTIDLSKIFKMETKETMNISPAGGELVVPVYTTADYTYKVTGCPGWLSYTLPTKGFHKDEIVFSAGANETGAERSASVTISWGEGQTRTFTVAQAALFMDFVNTEANPIKWEENFSVYAKESDATPVYTYKNVFTIELSDDFSKGTYKVKNIFVYNDAYTGNVAGTYYANYVAGTFTVIKNDSGYPFSNNTVALTYNEVEKTFTASSPIPFGYNYTATYLKNGGFIKGYTAAVKVEEESGASVSPADLVGNWSESYTAGDPETSDSMTIELSDDTTKGQLKVTMLNGYNGSITCYAKLSDDGKTLIVFANGMPFGDGNYLRQDIPLTINDGGKTLEYSGNIENDWGMPIGDFVATKQGGAVDPLDAFVGTWTETYINKPYSWSSETRHDGEFTVSMVDGKLYFEGMFTYKKYSSEYKSNYYGVLSADGTTITLEDANGNHNEFGPVEYAGGVVLNVEGNTLTVSSAFNGNVSNYVATKK